MWLLIIAGVLVLCAAVFLYELACSPLLEADEMTEVRR